MKKKVLVIGNGGREHALVWKLAQSRKVSQLFIAPGNPGTAQLGKNIDIAANDISALLAFAKQETIDLTVIGPDDILAAGIVDTFQKEGLCIFGPTKAAAKLEWSKTFSKKLMHKHHLPTAHFQTFTNYTKALAYAKQQSLPLVVKASGLALGKGVFICPTQEEVQQVLNDLLLNQSLGKAGSEVVIEEYLEGPELSAHVVSDGKAHILFPFAQDHKRVGEANTGPNTGGMGSYAPVSWVTQEQHQAITEKIIKPTFQAIKDEIGVFQGCLFPGLLLTKDGPKILEFNARFGDPETQSYMRLLTSDLYDLLEAAARGSLESVKVSWSSLFTVCVILTSGGYPGTYKKGKEIRGIKAAEKIPGVVVFHAGTTMSKGKVITSGGRVLGISAVGTTLQEARETAYQAVEKISFSGMYFRRDIAICFELRKTNSNMSGFKN